jgi:hypothetical protein
MEQTRRETMAERAYKTMKQVGAGSIALGIITVIFGVVCGIMAIVNGARLLRRKKDILF